MNDELKHSGVSIDLIEHRETLQAELSTLNLKADITQLEDALRYHSQADNLIESFGDYIDPLEPLRADPEFFGGPTSTHISRGNDRRYGDNYPIFNQEQTLSFIRGAGEWIAQTDSTALGALETLASYVIGTGFTWQATGDDERASQIVQRIVDEFCERERWCGGLDRELFKRTRKSGERFVRLHYLPGGISEVEVYEPSWITSPLNVGEAADYFGLPYDMDWKYGICTEPGRATKVHGYSVFKHGDPTLFEFVTVDEMSHVKINVDRNVKRGVTDFYVNEEWITCASKLLRRTVDGGTIQASIALIRQWNPKASTANITSASESLVKFQSKLPNYENTAGYTDVPTERFYSGKIMDVRGAEYKPGPMGGSNANTYMDIVQASLRKAANRWNMPEFMISGDASNANYSSTLVSESPFVKFCEHMQAQTEIDDADVFWRVVKHAADRGRVQGYTYADLFQLVTLEASPPDIATRDRVQENTIRQAEHQAGILSRETWSSEVGRDYKEERKRIDKEPGVANTGEVPPQQEKQMASASVSALSAAMESAETIEDAKALVESIKSSSLIEHLKGRKGSHDEKTHGHSGKSTPSSSKDGGETPRNETKSERSKRTHNPATKAKQDASEALEVSFSKKLGGVQSGDNEPMDIQSRGGMIGIELKMMHDAKADKVHMRKDSRQRKEAWVAEKKGRRAYTVVVDNRDKFEGGAHRDKYSGHKIYWKAGVGAFRLNSMNQASSIQDLRKAIGI